MDTPLKRVGAIALILGVIFLTALIISFNGYYQASASTYPSGIATFATTSTVSVGTDKPNAASTTVTVFGLPTNCVSRVITTSWKPIMLLFSNVAISSTTANPSGSIGHLQLASTTVVYDSGQFGCGFVSGFGFDSTTTIQVSEFR